jgi:hypothetical protein
MDNEMTPIGNRGAVLARTEWLKHVLEYLGGECDEPPKGFPIELSNWLFWGMWWGALSILIFLFCGQSSKFIYIDF